MDLHDHTAAEPCNVFMHNRFLFCNTIQNWVQHPCQESCNVVCTLLEPEPVRHAKEAGDSDDGTIIGQRGFPKLALRWLRCQSPSDIYTGHRVNGHLHKTGHLRSGTTNTEEYCMWEVDNMLATFCRFGWTKKHMLALEIQSFGTSVVLLYIYFLRLAAQVHSHSETTHITFPIPYIP